MSEQNAKRSEDLLSSESRLDSLLDRLNSLGGAAAPVNEAPSRTLRSVPDLAPADESTADEPTADELLAEDGPDEELFVPPPLETIIEPVDETPVLFAPIEETPVQAAPVDEPETARFTLPPLPAPLFIEPIEPIALVEEIDPTIDEQPIALVEEIDPISVVETVTVHADADENADDWVSYHEEPTDPFDPAEAADIIESSASVGTIAPVSGGAEWASEPEPVSLLDAPGLFDELTVTEETADAAVHPLDIEETLDFSEFDGIDGVDGLEELANDLDLLSAVPPAPSQDLGPTGELGSLYESDEDLPLPDFTGVWVEPGEGTVWDKDAAVAEANGIPDPIERAGRGSGISVGRNELDSLRPVDEEQIEEEPESIARKLQLVMVVLFGLMALAVMYLDDPAAIDDIRSVYDGFFG